MNLLKAFIRYIRIIISEINKEDSMGTDNAGSVNRTPLSITENLLTLGGPNRPGDTIIRVKAVVMHWLNAPMQKPENTRGWWESGNAVGSAHYVIGTDGSILRTIPENEIAYHCGSSAPDPVSGRPYTDKARSIFGPEAFMGRSKRNNFITPNYFSIGIEMSHLNNDPGTFTNETQDSAARLAAAILKRNKLTADNLMTHNEVVGWKKCPKLWTDNPLLFERFKESVKKEMELI